jgi:hypothetical protein
MSLIICVCDAGSTQVFSEDRAGVYDGEGEFIKTHDGIVKSICITPEIIFGAVGLLSTGERMKTLIQGLADLSFDAIAEAIPRFARELMRGVATSRRTPACLCFLLTGWDSKSRRMRAIGWFFDDENFAPREARLELGTHQLILAPSPEAKKMASRLLQRGETLPAVFAQLADSFPEVGRGVISHTINPTGGFTLSPLEFVTVGSQASGWTAGSGNGLLGANDFFHSGTKSLKIVNPSAANSFSSKVISVINGRVYSLRGWIKTTALSTSAGNGAMFHITTPFSGVTGISVVSVVAGTDFSTLNNVWIGLPADGVARDWTFVEILWKPTGSGTVTLYTQLVGTTGSAWFDDYGVYPTGGGWSGLSASTGYYLYSYIDALTGWLLFANGNPPPTSPSDTLAIQCALDGRIALPVKHITTPASGGTGSDTGGGSGTCPEFDAPVFVRRYSQGGDLIFDGIIKAGEVQPGYESDDGAIKRGDFLKGYSFKKQTDVYRAVMRGALVPCAGWMRIDGTRFTACETIWDGPFDGGQWLPAWKVSGAIQDSTVGMKVLIEVEADWDDEHNYYAGGRLIHNAGVLAC